MYNVILIVALMTSLKYEQIVFYRYRLLEAKVETLSQLQNVRTLMDREQVCKLNCANEKYKHMALRQ